MPLDRAHLTRASLKILPGYPFLAAWLGLVYVLDPQGRNQNNPGLALARILLPMPVWGALFLTLAGLMWWALWRGRRGVPGARTVFTYALYLYMIVAVLWAAVYAGACFVSPDASLAGPAWPLFVARAARASATSLENHETGKV